MVNAKLVKLAIKRDPNVPIGQAAPLHLDCLCGTTLPIDRSLFIDCPTCGAQYDSSGWLLKGGQFGKPNRA